MDSAEAEQEKQLRKKYGGLLPKKPIMAKDHERAFFDSADWALNKQKGAPAGMERPSEEELPPKLEPTPHTPLPARRPSYVDGTEGKS